jgi:hypothetical protein
MARKWPLSIEELQAAKAVLYDQLSFAEVAAKYSARVEETYSSSFTHKCICPNPRHKNGNERTPSFNFSERDKGFVCFGCGIHGDMFDLIALLEGMPWYQAVRMFLEKESIDLEGIDLDSFKDRVIYQHDYFYDANLHLGTKLRDYLNELQGSPLYEQDANWVDAMFRRIDNRFSKLPDKDFEQAHAFQSQILMEIDRRRAMNKERAA